MRLGGIWAAALALTRAGYTVEIRLVPFERAMETVKTEGIMTGSSSALAPFRMRPA